MATSAQFRMADRLAGGRLVERMATLRTAGLSYQHVARELYGEFGIEVTHETVRAWCLDLDIEKGDPDAKAATA